MEERPVIRYCEAPDGLMLACQVLGEGRLEPPLAEGWLPSRRSSLRGAGVPQVRRMGRFGEVAADRYP
jgi:hypothetical protein